MQITLEDIYKGKTTKIAVNRERLCAKCDGKGGKEGAVQTCSTCKGRGMVTKMQMIGPGMYTQSQGPCDDCRGQGEMIDEKNKCKECNGKKVCKEKKIIEVNIDKGSPNGCVYTFHGEADEYPGQEPGDVLIICQEKPHKTFKRKGADIMMEKTITLYEALTGVDFMVTHLDGQKIRVKSTPGEVIKPDGIKTILDKGLPFHKTSFKFGNLFILFKVTFPEKLEENALKPLTALSFMKTSQTDNDAAATVCMLEGFNEGQRNTHAQGGTTGDESDEDEEGHGGQRVRCAQQ